VNEDELLTLDPGRGAPARKARRPDEPTPPSGRGAAVAADNELAARVVGCAECLDGGADVRTAGLECGIACDERVNGGKGG